MANTITKKAMIDFIEKSGKVINFSRSYFNHLLKWQVEYTYNHIKQWIEEHNETID